MPKAALSPSPVQLTLLRDTSHGGAATQPAEIAKLMTDFVTKAQHTLHIAIYDFRLTEALGKNFVQALIDRAEAGVDVKIAYDHTKPNAKTQDAFDKLGGDPAPKGTHEVMTKLRKTSKVQTKPILTIPAAVANDPVNTEPIVGSHLMHSKYIVRDTHTAQAVVLTGSTNFTDDAWTHQENNILQITSPQLAQMYETDFQDLWTSGNIKSTGVNDKGTVSVGGMDIEVAFAPGEGASIDASIASLVSGLISGATTRLKIASMVITSAKVLGALNDALDNGIALTGIYDGSEMDHIVVEWEKSGSPNAALFKNIAKHLVKKASIPFSPTATHNFMHDKVLVCDDSVATGSFNFSKNATMNAENSLILHNKPMADDFADYIDKIVQAYKNVKHA